MWWSQKGHKWRHNMAHMSCMLIKQGYLHAHADALEHTHACASKNTQMYVIFIYNNDSRTCLQCLSPRNIITNPFPCMSYPLNLKIVTTDSSDFLLPKYTASQFIVTSVITSKLTKAIRYAWLRIERGWPVPKACLCTKRNKLIKHFRVSTADQPLLQHLFRYVLTCTWPCTVTLSCPLPPYYQQFMLDTQL
jgi:hypothetical protein